MEVSFTNSKYSQALSAVTISQLPNELLTLIFKYLNGCDVISFASTCKRFSSLSQCVTSLNLENRNSSLGKSLPVVSSFFKSHLNPSLLRSCNLNGCYWINVPTLRTFLVKCTNLEELYVAETKLSIRDIVMSILPKCSKVTKLSFTLNRRDWSSYSKHLGNRKVPTLCRLKSVELFVADSCSLQRETLHFLQSCEKLEEIVVCHSLISRIDIICSCDDKLSRNPSILKSVVFVAKQDEKYPKEVCQFFHVRESSNLTTFWCNVLQLQSNSQNLNNLTSAAWVVPGIRNPRIPIDILHHGLQLGHLESYWEPVPILMKSVLDSPTKLKLIICYYDSNHFQNFCENHPLLEVLKLDIGTGSNVGKIQTDWNTNSWKNLSRLRILSLRPALIVDHETRFPYLKCIVQSCPLIQELEIIGDDGDYTHLTEEELSSIAQFGPSLKRLTLANLKVNNGLVLEQILKGCNQLQSLRLKNIIGPSSAADPCFYADNLIKALPTAKNLKTFCLFQKNVTQMELLLDSLESCTSISRLSLVCPSSSDSFSKKITKEDFTNRLIRLCDKMSQLVALFCFFGVPEEHCEEAYYTLKRRFEIERPAFRVLVQSVLRYDQEWDGTFPNSYFSNEFPVMHKDLLIGFKSQVALFPYNCNTFLQRNL